MIYGNIIETQTVIGRHTPEINLISICIQGSCVENLFEFFVRQIQLPITGKLIYLFKHNSLKRDERKLQRRQNYCDAEKSQRKYSDRNNFK